MTHKLTTFVSGNYSLLSASDEKNILRGVSPLNLISYNQLFVPSNSTYEFTFPTSARIISLHSPTYVTFTFSLGEGYHTLPVAEGHIFREGDKILIENANAFESVIFLYFEEVILNATI